MNLWSSASASWNTGITGLPHHVTVFFFLPRLMEFVQVLALKTLFSQKHLFFIPFLLSSFFFLTSMFYLMRSSAVYMHVYVYICLVFNVHTCVCSHTWPCVAVVLVSVFSLELHTFLGFHVHVFYMFSSNSRRSHLTAQALSHSPRTAQPFQSPFGP